MGLPSRSNNTFALLTGICERNNVTNEQNNGKKMATEADRTKVPRGKMPAGASRPLLTGMNRQKNEKRITMNADRQLENLYNRCEFSL
jgi:hypothetical protein